MVLLCTSCYDEIILAEIVLSGSFFIPDLVLFSNDFLPLNFILLLMSSVINLIFYLI